MWLFADLFFCVCFFDAQSIDNSTQTTHPVFLFFFKTALASRIRVNIWLFWFRCLQDVSKKSGKGQQHLFGCFNRWTGGERSSKSSVIRIKDGVRLKTLWNTWLYQGTLCKNVWLHFVFIYATSQLLCNVVPLQLGLDTVDYRSLLFEFVMYVKPNTLEDMKKATLCNFFTLYSNSLRIIWWYSFL